MPNLLFELPLSCQPLRAFCFHLKAAICPIKLLGCVCAVFVIHFSMHAAKEFFKSKGTKGTVNISLGNQASIFASLA